MYRLQSITKPHLLPYTNQKLSCYSGSILVECKLFKMRIIIIIIIYNTLQHRVYNMYKREEKCTGGNQYKLNTALCLPEMSTVEVVKSE